ncbi:MDR family NADP-dependent oxidoreductase [Umezawaea beigongshangensis]|uniref:MDR family NADP-dependent oxidoreductase n=1 Tax=Umezawaea beigongshangensis TaxID=2780383 RepID=UPI0018F1FEF7|nr:NADP-dependent oxidoreductase [Umezawaea beigongshangensis]
MPALPTVSREVRLAVAPDGPATSAHLAVVEVPPPVPGDGEVLVANRHFLVFAALLRTMMSSGVQEHGGIRPGDVLPGPAIGEVISAPEDSGLRPGDLVSHGRGWREHVVLPVAECSPLGDDLPDPVAHLSQGWSAYAALTRAVEVRPGDTVFITGGAGALGALAGQIARLLGAGRVIGSTGSPAKVERMLSELGYDAVVVRGAEPVAEQLAKAAPDGVDVLVDTVGGEQLRAAVAQARPHARFVVVGVLSAQLAEHADADALVEVDLAPIVLRRVQVRGFNAADHPDALPEWTERFGGWLRSGQITFPHVRVDGIDRAPLAFDEVIAGRHLGAVVVDL